MSKTIYAIVMLDPVDHHGNRSQQGDKPKIVGVFETPEELEERMAAIQSNPYFGGSLSVITYKIGTDYSGYGDYTKVKTS